MAPATTTNVRGITMRKSSKCGKCGAGTVGIPAALAQVPLCPACFVAATTEADRMFQRTGMDVAPATRGRPAAPRR